MSNTDTKLATSSAMYATMYRNGRADYRAGREFSQHAADAWKAGWHDEAHLVARTVKLMNGATIADVRTLDALEDAARVLRSGVTTRPTLTQAKLLDAARLSIPDALRRLREAHDPTDADDGEADRIPA